MAEITLEYLLLLFLITCGCCLRLLELEVPELADIRDSVTLSCHFDLEGARLYSVKWYKDELEFFRYMPDNSPNVQTFHVDGVHLLERKSNLTHVHLHPLSYTTSGVYRCEVSTEAPHFKTVFQHSNMTVLGLPRGDPSIVGVESTYSVGNFVTANCTSAPSNPPAHIQWLINGVQAEQWLLLHYYTPKSKESMGLETSTVGLRLQLDNGHFLHREGILTLICKSTVAGIVRKSELKSHLAKLTNEKFAQEIHLNTGSTSNHIMLFLTTILCFTASKLF